MKESQDAYGRIVLDHLNGAVTWEIVERDDGWMGLSGGAPSYFAPFRLWPARQRKALRFVRGRVLDVGCGAGRWSLHLQKRGREVTAIDASPLAVEVSRRRGVRDARVVPIGRVSEAMGRFDTIVMMGNNFGLFGGWDEGRRLLRRFHAMTRPGARIVAETNDPFQTANPDHKAYHELNRRRGRMGGQLLLRIRYRAYATPWFDYLMVSTDEMRAMLDGTGWALDRVIEDGGSAYVAVIARRPES
jgi:SAM-dependent methyltransferase